MARISNKLPNWRRDRSLGLPVGWDSVTGGKSLGQLCFVNQLAGRGICFQINVFVCNLDKTV